MKLVNNAGQNFEVVSEFKKKRANGKGSHTMWTILFEGTDTMMTVYKENALQGKVKDPYQVSVYGVGYLGFFTHSKPYWKKAKQLWRNMMKRCYCEEDSKGYYGTGVSVCKRWHDFSNFLEDVSKLDNFDKWLENTTIYNLDKDLKIIGNKVYSRQACSFVHESLNKVSSKPFTNKPLVGKS